MPERDELPGVAWRTRLAPGFDRRDQLRLYTEATSAEAARRQVRLHREELAKAARRKPSSP